MLRETQVVARHQDLDLQGMFLVWWNLRSHLQANAGSRVRCLPARV